MTLSSGQTAQYYVDARRAIMRPAGFRAAGELIAAAATEAGAAAVGGPVMAAIPLACAAIAVPGGDDLVGFFVRKERKQHGLQRWVEGPVEDGAKVLVVEDTVTTGGSTVSAIERIREEGSTSSGPSAWSTAWPAEATRSPPPRTRPFGPSRRSTTFTRTAPTADLAASDGSRSRPCERWFDDCDEIGEGVRGKRTAEVVALREIALVIVEQIERMLVLDALRDHLQT